jgi:hypothetical protein
MALALAWFGVVLYEKLFNFGFVRCTDVFA